MLFPGEERLKRRILRRIYKEKFLNLLRRLAGKPPKPYSWESNDDSDPVCYKSLIISKSKNLGLIYDNEDP